MSRHRTPFLPTFACLVALGLAGASRPARAGELQQFVNETQRIEQTEGRFRLVWWIPTEYWKESFSKTLMTDAQKEGFYKAVDDYLVLCIVDVGTVRNLMPRPREELLKELTVAVGAGKPVGPLPDESVNQETRRVLTLIKPLMTTMLGQFGKSMEFVCFPGKDETGARLADPHQPGTLNVKLGEASYAFRLPLGAVLPPRFDPQTGEKFPGSYQFNPYTGTKLTETPAK